MSFNVRTGFADFTPSTIWKSPFSTNCRRKACAACILEHAPDVVATQEALVWQLRDLRKDLGGRYAYVGRSRGTSWFNDETSAILYDCYRWEVKTSRGMALTGDFMLSPTPKAWGSAYPGASYPMITTWVVLGPRGVIGGPLFLVASTHLDPCSKEVRAISAKQAREEAETLRRLHGCSHAFVLGDFNADFTEEAYETFLGNGWLDVYRRHHGEYERGSNTFHAFHGLDYRPAGPEESDPEYCIDFIFALPADVEVRSAQVDKRRYCADGPEGSDAGGIFPSDHYPVIADVVLPGRVAP